MHEKTLQIQYQHCTVNTTSPIRKPDHTYSLLRYSVISTRSYTHVVTFTEMIFFQSLLLFGILSLSYFYWRCRKARRYFDQNNIPYIKPNLIFGNITEVIFGRKSMIEILHEFYENFQAYKIVGIFTAERTIVMIRDPVLIKRILSEDTDYFMSQAQISYREVDRGGLASLIGKNFRNLYKLLFYICTYTYTFFDNS